MKDLRDLQNRVNMLSCRSSHVVGGSGLAPSVAELPCPAAKTCPHIGIPEIEDRAGLIDSLCSHEFKIAVPILGNP